MAERWSIPAATTLRAKGVLPKDHALSLGVFGYAGTRHATDAILGGELDCLIVLGSGFNERDTMHWTVRERSKALMIHVNTDMDELTANGDLGHVVPGSCHAFLDLMQERAASIAPALQSGEAHRREWLEAIKAGPRLYALAQAILANTTAWRVVPDDLQARAAAVWGTRGLVEIVVLSGFYQMFAAINQGFDIQGTEDRGRRTD